MKAAAAVAGLRAELEGKRLSELSEWQRLLAGLLWCLDNRVFGITERTLEDLLDRALALRAWPIPMLLQCPACHVPHLDEPDPAKGWANPPHRTHQCQQCGTEWRPAHVATTGVARLP